MGRRARWEQASTRLASFGDFVFFLRRSGFRFGGLGWCWKIRCLLSSGFSLRIQAACVFLPLTDPDPKDYFFDPCSFVTTSFFFPADEVYGF